MREKKKKRKKGGKKVDLTEDVNLTCVLRGEKGQVELKCVCAQR